MKKFALIVAGGSGTRMGEEIPKQFLEMNGVPILMHTIKAFLTSDPAFEIILVLPPSQIDFWKKLCVEKGFLHEHKIASGGTTRFHSVKNGLNQINEMGIVFIHDGVRPLVSKETIKNCDDLATRNGNALPVVPVSESVRYADKHGNKSVDRSNYFLVQTPQTFQTQLIKTAYLQAYSEKFTDDASVLEAFGQKIHLVEGNRENIKITYPEDLFVASALQKNML